MTLRNAVMFRHPAEFVPIADVDDVLSADGAAWFVDILARVPGLVVRSRSMTHDVVLTADPTGPVEFFHDLCRMVEAIAERVGETASVVDDDERARTYRVSATALEALERSSGIHRGQLAPAAGDGRIVTARVTITTGAAVADRMVRTYNYPLQVVTDHATGARMELALALKGLR